MAVVIFIMNNDKSYGRSWPNATVEHSYELRIDIASNRKNSLPRLSFKIERTTSKENARKTIKLNHAIPIKKL
jgi:hypothetical protein